MGLILHISLVIFAASAGEKGNSSLICEPSNKHTTITTVPIQNKTVQAENDIPDILSPNASYHGNESRSNISNNIDTLDDLESIEDLNLADQKHGLCSSS
ncbi:hypothetical protein OnM2_05983 [Erysiphe neolycopersici]|uniref:Uncharacterized protein n=1 Tax=Erysiphe neolycopersici TaxID=212602 RepID=A0A420I6J4_9PEZI|nr:hypothetical protein OnM2_05983 [Erysiphe neolycopersici]